MGSDSVGKEGLQWALGHISVSVNITGVEELAVFLVGKEVATAVDVLKVTLVGLSWDEGGSSGHKAGNKDYSQHGELTTRVEIFAFA